MTEYTPPEPAYYWEPVGEWGGSPGFSTNTGPADGWKITHYYTLSQLRDEVAKARSAAIEEVAIEMDGLFSLGGDDIGKVIRSLK